MQTIPPPEEIVPLSAFVNAPLQHVRSSRLAKRPLMLKDKDRIAAVMLSHTAYKGLLAALDRAESVASIRQSMLDVADGRVYPAREALERIRESARRRARKRAKR